MSDQDQEGITSESGEDSDPLIDAYKKDVDRTLLRENLKLSVPERCRKFLRNMALAYELSRSARTQRPGT